MFTNKLKNFSLPLSFSLLASVLIGIILGLFIILIIGKIFRNKYAVFFLEDGSVYFGKLSFFNKYHLKNPIFLRQDQNGNLNVVYYRTLFYSPQDVLYLNPQKVLFWSYLQDNSPLINYIEGKIPIQQSQVPSPSQTVPQQSQTPSSLQQIPTSTQ